MATSGKRTLAAVVAVVVVGAAGCTPTASPPPPPDPPGPSVAMQPSEACLVPLPQTWQAAFDAGAFLRDPGEHPLVRLVADDSSLLVEYGHRGIHHEVRWVPSDGGAPVVVQTFGPDQREAQIMGASFDGRYVTYAVAWEMLLFSSWTLYVWDSHTRDEPRQVAVSGHDDDGELLPGPFLYPVSYEGTVLWVQPTGDDPDDQQQNAIYRYRIAEDRLEVVRTGHHANLFRFGSLLVWPESSAPGALARLRALSLVTGEPADLPAPLADLEGAAYLAASEDTVAWIDSKMQELWVWRTGWAEPSRLISSWDHDYMEWVGISGDIVTWHGTIAQFALDLRSGSYTQITPEYGSQKAQGRHLYVGFYGGRADDGQPLPSDQTVVDTTTLPPLPTCQ